MSDEEIRKQILKVLQDCMRDFDYGYSKEVGVLNIRMVNRNKASYKLLELFKNINSELEKKKVPFGIALLKSKQAYKPDPNADIPF